MADWNRVTEHAHIPEAATLWLVAAEWRGGHDLRVLRLHNIHLSKSAAVAEWERLTPENHNAQYSFPQGTDRGFIRLPLRQFSEVKTNGNAIPGQPDD